MQKVNVLFVCVQTNLGQFHLESLVTVIGTVMKYLWTHFLNMSLHSG